MYAVEFEADIQNGVVKIPKEYQQLENRHAKVVVMVSSESQQLEVNQSTAPDFSQLEIKAFSGVDAVEMQRKVRDEW
jgi:hypothetical protein